MVHERKGTQFMRRFTTMLAGVVLAASAPFAANAAVIDPNTTQFTTGGIDVTAPVDGNLEVAGPNTAIVTITAPNATFAGSSALTFDVVVFVHDATGVVLTTQTFGGVLGGAVSSDVAGALPPQNIDFSMTGAPANLGANLTTAINTARSFVTSGLDVDGMGPGGPATGVGIGIVVNDAVPNGADTLLDLTDETMDEVITPDTAGPVLTSVFLDGTARMIFVFDDNISGSTFANLTSADFESSATSGGMFAAFANAAFGNPSAIIASSSGKALALPITAAGPLVPTVGQFARIVTAGGPPAVNADLFDISGNVADDSNAQAQLGTVISAVAAPTITGAKWLKTVGAGATVAGALRVDFSTNVNSGALGDLDFWDHVAGAGGDSIVASTAFGGADDLQVTAVDAFNAAFPNSVFLTVTSTAAATLAQDGKDDSAGGLTPRSFTLSVDATIGTPPQDFLATPLAGTSSSAIGDGIAPTAVGNPFTLDSNGDGVIDTFGWNFNEPIDVSSAASAGFTLTKLAVNTHPMPLFQANLAAGNTDDPTNALNQTTIVLDAMTPANDEFTSSILATGGFTRASQDAAGTNRLQFNNQLQIHFDSDMVDWDNDTLLGSADIIDLNAMPVVPGEATPGTFDTNFASVVIDKTTSLLTDANANALSANATSGGLTDGAGPVAARADFSTGDNLAGGNQKPSEQDGSVGDNTTNNTAFVTFNESVNAGGIDETKFRFGVTSTERFANGNSNGVSGAGNNILSLTDSGGNGFEPGDTFTIATANGVTDGPNAYPGSGGSGAPALTVQDVTAPYVILQQDINGNIINSAFLGGIDANGFATTLTLTFSQDIKAGTEGVAADWTIEGVSPAVAPILAGNLLTFTFPSGLVAADNTINVTYNGATAANLLAANAGSMGKVSAMNDTFTAQQVPTANVDGEFLATMDIAGVITGTDGSTLAPSGTKVFGMIATPRAISTSFTMGGVKVVIDDSASLAAITNAMLGLETNLYLLIDSEQMQFSNEKDDAAFGTTDAIISININTNNSGAITFTGTGSTTLLGGGGGNVKVDGTGVIDVCWDVLRSSDGTAFNLFNKGFALGGQPITSAAVVTKDDGAYTLHMTAPISAFNSALNAIGWPVIIVVELPNGNRFQVTSLLNGSDLLGAITFQGLNRQSDPLNSDGNLVFNPNLGNVANRGLYGGWNILADDRNSGWQASNNDVLLPAGVSNIVTGTTLNNTSPFDQFGYFVDTNGDGNWTAADDTATRFDGIAVSVGCMDMIGFVMDDNGVSVNDDIDAFTGGYAAGVFNGVATVGGNPVRVGVFQFGPQISASTVFTALTGTGSFPNDNVTLGWALVTSPVTSSNIPNFLANNGSDFLILFNRTGHNAVDISTSADATEINQGDALFLHK